VFLDVDDLQPGCFDQALLDSIKNALSFIIILSPGSLMPCAAQGDWMRAELACALANEKNVIPIMMPGFTFPEENDLPEDIRTIRMHQGVSYSHEFFGAVIDKIVSYLRT
jgi:hypothetical protein